MSFIASWFAFRIHWSFPVILGLLAIITAYTRHVLEAHDRTDIAAGVALGIVTGLTVCILLSGYNSQPAALVSLALTIVLFLYVPHREFTKK